MYYVRLNSKVERIYYLISIDPRKRPRCPSPENAQLRRDRHYLEWLIREGIPGNQRNLNYFEHMIGNVSNDIKTADEQLNALLAMEADVNQSQQVVALMKMRKQMIDKLEEFKGKAEKCKKNIQGQYRLCLLYTSPSPRDRQKSRMPSSA